MPRLRVLYLPEPHLETQHIVDAVAPRHDLAIFDRSAPLVPQFDAVDVVVDSGGSVGTRAMLDAAPRVRLWQIIGSGFEHFDVPYWRARGVAVANCPGTASGPALAERAMLLMLLLTHRFREAQHNLEQRILFVPAVEELGGKLLGLVGFGASGIELAKRARAFGMRLAAVDVRDISPTEMADRGLDWVGKATALDELLAMADVVSLHVHLNEETRGLIDERRLRLLKPNALLINVARGALVDEQALARVLAEGRIAGAGLDAFGVEPPNPTSELLRHPNVVATPHTAGNSDGTLRLRAEFCARNVDRVASGLEPECRIA